MASHSDLTLPFRFHPALHAAAAQSVQTISLIYQEPMLRNPTQRNLLSGHVPAAQTWSGGSDPCEDQCVRYNVRNADGSPVTLSAHNGEPLFQEDLYLFNVIVALEWEPDLKTYQQLRTAFARASDFLYDATNGSMAFGQVVIGGRELMEGADIQIMASSRIHPRAWIDALNVAEKFKPIRVGRGLWQKESEKLLNWDTPEGYRTLIHEWGHYAFGLVDRHLDRLTLGAEGAAFWTADAAGEIQIAAPQVALAVETLMATVQISEFIEAAEIVAGIQNRYPNVTGSVLEGPDELALPLPEIIVLDPRLSANAEQSAETLGATAPEPLNLEDLFEDIKALAGNPGEYVAHWLYLLKLAMDGDLPERIVAQGKVSLREPAKAFQLFDAAPGDTVLVISQLGATVRVHQAALPFQKDSLADVTPPCFAGTTVEPLLVDVIPAAFEPAATAALYPMQAEVSLHVTTEFSPHSVGLFPAGGPAGVPIQWDQAQRRTLNAVTVPHLDGHVLLQWGNPRNPETLQRFVCSYSQGGGPNTSGGGRVPITGGSADGNAMIFFADNASPDAAATDNPGDQGVRVATDNDGDQGVRVVTTTLVVGQQNLFNAIEARSYIFGVASNAPLATYRPALVLYYDREALKPGGDLLIHRWDGANWQPLRTLNRLDPPYLAIPLTTNTNAPGTEAFAPTLAPVQINGAPLDRVEHYRIFWNPHSDRGSSVTAS